MYYCRDFYNLSILSLYEGELIGIVDKLYFDKKLKKICKLELIGNDGMRLNLLSKNIYHIGKNAITIKNNQLVTIEEGYSDCVCSPIGSKAYSITGEFLGIVDNIKINNKYCCEKILLDNGNLLDIRDLATCGKNTIIFYNNDQKVNLNKFVPTTQPKELKNEKELSVAILPTENKKDVPPARINQDATFLIGRVCTKDIFNFNNELLIKAHGVVNKKNLKEISKFGKLRELMLYLK